MKKRLNHYRRFLAIILFVVMCCSLMPYHVEAAEDYREWNQADARWGNIKLGTSDKTMESSGCLVTAVTKLAIQCGLKDSETFNPAILVNWLNENEGFSGASLYWGKPAELIEGFSYYSNKLLSSGNYNINEYTDTIIDWIKNGFHIVLQVKDGGHWVAVDEAMTLKNGEIYIMDSQPYNQNADIRLEDRYSNFNRAEAYRGGITPDTDVPDIVLPDIDEPDTEGPDIDEPDSDEPDIIIPDIDKPNDENPFVDVEESNYYYTSVLWAYKNGITNGTDQTHFAPSNPCTRADIVTFLWRAEGKPNADIENPFEDVKEGKYYTEAVLWAVENGITTGVNETHFNPEDYCTREQIVTFLWRAEGKPKVDIENPFEDVEEGRYYTQAVLWAVENEITTGVNETHFNPGDICTRGQAVTFLYRQYGSKGTIII